MPLHTNQSRSHNVKPLTDTLLSVMLRERPFVDQQRLASEIPQEDPNIQSWGIWMILKPYLQADPDGNQALYHLTRNADDSAARRQLRERLYRILYRNPVLVTQLQNTLQSVANDGIVTTLESSR